MYTSRLERLPTEILSAIIESHFHSSEPITTITHICRRLRYVAFGMTSLWNNIVLLEEQSPREYYSEDGQICCLTEDVLRFVLDRAGSVALSLEVQWRVMDGTLELIGSYNAPIRYLEIFNDLEKGVNAGRFGTLNLCSLSKIRMMALGHEAVNEILDLAMKSNCKELILHSDVPLDQVESHPMTRHRLLQRVTHLHLELDIDGDDFSGDFEEVIWNLPQIKSWKVDAPPQALSMIDLRQAEKLDFSCRYGRDGLRIEAIPIQLTELSLNCPNFRPHMRSVHGVQLMSNLVTLELGWVSFDESPYQYFSFPNLKELYLCCVWFHTYDKNEKGNPVVLSEGSFFQGIPKLERLRLYSMKTKDPFCTTLGQCLNLTDFTMDSCSIQDFLPSFVDSIKNGPSFISLKNLHIDTSWPRQCDLSFTEFATTCSRYRQGLGISGNRRINHFY
ncbi:hypothetical protein CPB86DRAFT_57697 [Serendipita vermifera]|nr:hypothetical protein CPB86DRAFT_57697 [Serendipita vermifera]